MWLTLWLSLWGSCVRHEADCSFQKAASQALLTLFQPGRFWRVCFVCGNCLWLRGRKEIILFRRIASPLWFRCTTSEKSCFSLCRGCFTLKLGSSRYTKPQEERMLLSIWLVSSMACVYPLFRRRMEVKAMAALGKTLTSCLASARKLTVTSCLSYLVSEQSLVPVWTIT